MKYIPLGVQVSLVEHQNVAHRYFQEFCCGTKFWGFEFIFRLRCHQIKLYQGITGGNITGSQEVGPWPTTSTSVGVARLLSISEIRLKCTSSEYWSWLNVSLGPQGDSWTLLKLCSLLERNCCQFYPEDVGSRFLWSASNFLQDHTVISQNSNPHSCWRLSVLLRSLQTAWCFKGTYYLHFQGWCVSQIRNKHKQMASWS